MSAAAPQPPKRVSARIGCSRMPRPPARFSKFPREHDPAISAGPRVIHDPWRIAMSVVSGDIKPLTFFFEDDGLVPNNPLPLVIYKGAVDIANAHPEKTIE